MLEHLCLQVTLQYNVHAFSIISENFVPVIMPAGKALCTSLLRCFPEDMSLAFAYGSAVFQQSGYSRTASKMVDFVFVVDNPYEWHRKNLGMNKNHYSFLKYLGAHRVSTIQNRIGAGVYYNTLVKCDDVLIKYGIINTKTLQEDLLEWKSMYIAGRLHKPVMILKQKASKLLEYSLKSNLEHAVNVSLLLLPETFTEEQLYITIAGLSYAGDFRMTVGEDKNKVSNIVKPNLAHFQELYSPILKSMEYVQWNRESMTMQQDRSPSNLLSLMFNLPKHLQTTILKNVSNRNEDMEEIFQKLTYSGLTKQAVQDGIQSIVSSSSWSQSLKAILMAGIFKSVRYGSQKLKKMMKGGRMK
ncbi:phosphatidate cytidylyltransferase, mitochondrial-like isoform X3 [Ptychodera flava]|uniref:phosphatidate cytidylyltransferase, mitochondrial-like isoform X3 n=1 Tax=Ptychodera flava TaxID=63121 RepID=UPI00396A18DA